jgi:hypothetical protein
MTQGLGARVFDITCKFIGPIDVMVMGVTAVDEILPHIRDLNSALSSYPNMPSSYKGTATINKWLGILQTKKASEELSEDEIR